MLKILEVHMNGAELPPVDIITFGSPCQDMSVAGKRTGLAGEQSGLFHEAIRIVKEMRENTLETNRDISCGRMSQAPSAATEGRTSKPSSKRSSGSKSRAPRCLRLIKTDGHTPMCTWETDGAWHDRFYSRIFCAHCGGKFIRKNWKGNCAAFWKCENAQKKNGHTCDAEIIHEDVLRRGVVIAWNNLVEQRDELLPRWEQMATEGDALQRYRARMMIAITAEGPLDTEVPELTRSVLEEITVHSPTELTVAFLDGSERRIKI